MPEEVSDFQMNPVKLAAETNHARKSRNRRVNRAKDNVTANPRKGNPRKDSHGRTSRKRDSRKENLSERMKHSLASSAVKRKTEDETNPWIEKEMMKPAILSSRGQLQTQ